MLERRREKRPDLSRGDQGRGSFSSFRPTASANGGHCGDKSERGKNIFIGSWCSPSSTALRRLSGDSLNILSVSSVYSPLWLQI